MIVVMLFELVVIGFVICVSGEEQGSYPDPDNDSILSLQNILLSVSLLCTIVLVAVGCTWAWWKRVLCFWKKDGTHQAPPDWFVPGGLNSHPVTLDPANLASDTGVRINIDPLPSLTDLGVDGRDSFELRSYRAPGIVPSIDETEIHAEDWFQEPYISFPRGNLEYQQVIGKGWFGKIIEAEAVNIRQYIRTSNVIVRSLRDNASAEEQIRFLNDARMFRANESDNILKLLGFCVEKLPYILIFEYFPLGDLKGYLLGRGRQSPSLLKATDDGVLLRMIVDVIRGVKWMEQAGYVHGDLSARNCLVATSAGKVVIGDYGCSPQKYRKDYYCTNGYMIPIRWAAPETILFTSDAVHPQKVTHSANIWSLGVLIWEIFQLGKTPYENLTDDDVIRRVLTQKNYVLEPPHFPFVKNDTKDKIYQLLVSCWNSLPAHRPSIEAIEEVFTTPS